jgi:hypothetical protein
MSIFGLYALGKEKMMYTNRVKKLLEQLGQDPEKFKIEVREGKLEQAEPLDDVTMVYPCFIIDINNKKATCYEGA